MLPAPQELTVLRDGVNAEFQRYGWRGEGRGRTPGPPWVRLVWGGGRMEVGVKALARRGDLLVGWGEWRGSARARGVCMCAAGRHAPVRAAACQAGEARAWGRALQNSDAVGFCPADGVISLLTVL